MSKKEMTTEKRLKVRLYLSLLIYTVVGYGLTLLLDYIFSKFDNDIFAWIYWRLGPLFILYLVIGFVCIFNYYWKKPWDYLDEVIDATQTVYEQNSHTVSLSDPLKELEEQLNQIKMSVLLSKQAAKQAEEKKNEIVMYLAHDIRTPLTTVIGYLSLLHEASDMPEQQKEKYVKIALDKAERLERLINELFEITKYNAHTVIIKKENVDLHCLIAQVIDEIYPTLSANGNTAVFTAEDNLSKQFKDKTAVNDVSLTLTPGVWGLLGANGAGKTTLMRMIADIMTPTNGAVYYDGKDIRELGEVYRSRFGFLPQDFGYHRDFTVKDYLEYMAALKDIPTRATTQKINHLLDILSLSDVKKKKIFNLSGGMKRRVGIAQAMLNDPEILVMDEPTAGLDPGERVRLRNFISEFSHDRIVLISTHIVSDIEYISTRNAIMKAGEIVDVGTTAELVKRIEGKVWNCIIPTSKLPECEMRLRIINQRGEDHNQVSIRYLSEHSEIDGSVTTEPRLEDLYLWLFPQTDLEKEDR